MKPLAEFHMEVEQCRQMLGDDGLARYWWLLITWTSIWVYVIFSALVQKQNRWSLPHDGPIGLLWPFILPWNIGTGIATWLANRLSK